MLLTWPNSFPPQGEAGIWVFLTTCSAPSQVEGLWQVHVGCTKSLFLFFLSGSQHLEYIGSGQNLRPVRQKPVPWATLRRIRTLDIWSSPFLNSPGRSWEMETSSQSYGSMLGVGIMVIKRVEFSYWLQCAGLMLAWSAGVPQLVSEVLTKRIGSYVVADVSWGEGRFLLTLPFPSCSHV